MHCVGVQVQAHCDWEQLQVPLSEVQVLCLGMGKELQHTDFFKRVKLEYSEGLVFEPIVSFCTELLCVSNAKMLPYLRTEAKHVTVVRASCLSQCTIHTYAETQSIPNM